MTTSACDHVLTAGLTALQDPPAWTGRPVHCVSAERRSSWIEHEMAAEVAYLVMLGMAGGDVGLPEGRVVIECTPTYAHFYLPGPTARGWDVFSLGYNLGYWRPTREVLLMALAARWAAIEGDHATVDDFTRNVLGHADVAEWRDAVISGLLGDWVDRLGSFLTDPELLAILRGYTAAERRRWAGVWEHRFGGFQWRAPDGTVRAVRGKRVWLLETPNRDGVSVWDVLPDKPAAGALALDHDFTDPRIDAVLRGLDPAEAAVANLGCR